MRSLRKSLKKSRKLSRKLSRRNSKKVTRRVSKKRIKRRIKRRVSKRRVYKRRTSRRNLRGGSPLFGKKKSGKSSSVLTEPLNPTTKTYGAKYVFPAAQLAELEGAAEKGLKNPSEEELLSEGLSIHNKPCMGRIYTVNQETNIKFQATERSKILKTLPKGSRIICFQSGGGEPGYISIKEVEGDGDGYIKYYDDLNSGKALITDTGIFATFKDTRLDAALKNISIHSFHNIDFREAIHHLWYAINIATEQDVPFESSMIQNILKNCKRCLEKHSNSDTASNSQPLIDRVNQMITKGDEKQSAE